MSFKSIGQVATYKPLRRCNIEELAYVQRVAINSSGGVMFARTEDRAQKDAARQKILDLFHPEFWDGHLSILTMPGLHWRFERKLLGKREGNWMHKLADPSRTRITSVENDRFIYYSAVTQMPGLHTKRALTRSVEPPPFAEQGMRTKFVQIYFCNIDDLMCESTECWDAAWLDYTGPLSAERLRIIQMFFETSIRRVLIVTALKARWNKLTSEAILKAGGHSAWLQKHLRGEILHDLEYFDTSPMAQFAVRKENHELHP